uniref:Uncharacterized protein n=1 Tax=Psilocybe cubensis TaxID=181762 RepID=A0A8H7XPW3_PSICU
MSTLSSTSSIVPSSVAGESTIPGIQFSHPTTEELSKQVQSQQITIRQLEAKIRELQEELTNAKMLLVKKKKISANVPDCSAEENLTKDIQHLAKYHAIFIRPIIPKTLFGHPKPPFLPSDARKRYSDMSKLDLGHIAELYANFPSKYHSILGGENMDIAISTFTKAMSDIRSTVLNKIRTLATAVFPTIPSEVFLATRSAPSKSKSASSVSETAQKSVSSRPTSSASTRISTANPPITYLSEHPEIQRLLGGTCRRNQQTGDPFLVYENETVEVFPPVLFANGDGQNILGLFKSQYLLDIGKLTIYGPTALKEGVVRRMREDSPFLHIDKRPTCTTPGFIAWCCTAAVYTLSDDIEFTSSGVGSRTGRKYLSQHDMYTKYLITQYSSLTSLFKFWDATLFPHQASNNLPQQLVAPHPTVILIPNTLDPVGTMIANFTRQSSIADPDAITTEVEAEKTDSEEEFHPSSSITRFSSAVDSSHIVESDTNEAESDDGNMHPSLTLSPGTNPPAAHHDITTVYLPIEHAPTPSAQSSNPRPPASTSIPRNMPSTPGIDTASVPLTSLTVTLNLDVPVPQQLSAPKKRAGKKKAAPLEADNTLVPGNRVRATRASSRNVQRGK